MKGDAGTEENRVSEEPEDERGEAGDAVSLFITVHERWMTAEGTCCRVDQVISGSQINGFDVGQKGEGTRGAWCPKWNGFIVAAC